MAYLAKPSIKYKRSYLEGLKEFQDEGREAEYNYKEVKSDFENFVLKLNNQTKGIGLPEGWVPATHFWLIDKDEYIGNISIRHKLNDNLIRVGGHIGYSIRPSKRNMGYGITILKLSLPEVKKLGIDKALVTCDETNIGSKKIIEANGGILENIKEQGEGKPRKLRYWIKIS